MIRFKIGDKVQIHEGSGLDSGKKGTLITYSEYLNIGGDKEDFLTFRWGHNSKKLAYLKTDTNEPIVMFKSRLIKIC